ncbi:MAG: baseplate J/gp47 family protein [bacterium]|nr:baseplate J/gp47 family protein [bacterium]
MKLPFPFPFGKKEKKEYFLSLLLREEKATAVIFEELSGKIRIVGEHEESFSDFIDEISFEELLEVLDKTISTAESSLPNNVETQKTIFGLKETWIENSKIKKEYLLKLKKISEALGLIPIGFLVTHEAIAHLLQEEEGAPVSAILVEIGKKNIAVSLLRAGRITETKRAEIEESIPKTTDKILHHFVNYEILPSRIIIFNDKGQEKLSHEFISFTWSKSLPFLHIPQITALPEGFDAKAMLSGAATQMGFEILKEETQATRETEDAKVTEEKQESKETDITQETEMALETEETKDKDLFSGDFGFFKEKDVASLKPKQIEIEKKLETVEDEVYPEKKFVQEEKIKQTSSKIDSLFSSSGKKAVGYLKTFSAFIKAIPLPLFGNRKIVLIIPGIIFLLIVILLSYIFLLRSVIFLNIKPKIIDQKQNITFSLDSKTDASKNIISSEVISVSEEGSLSTPATGKKEIGEKAKGTITIYNSSLSEGKTFPKGTTVTSPNNLDFILDNSVTLASASGDASDITSSTAKIAITAKDIGKEYNLPSGTKFTIGSLPASTIIGKNDSAFSGGSKKEVTVVSKEDINKLLEELPKNLEPKAKEEIEKNISAEKSLLPIFVKTSFDKKNLDKDVGEETKTVNLTAKISYQGITYKKSDLEQFANAVLSKKYSQELTVSDNTVKTEVLDIKQENEKEVTATLVLKASLMPKVDIQKLTADLSGKKFDDAQKILSKLPQVESVEINLRPNLSFLPKLLPRLGKNISIVVKTNE